MMLSPRRRRQRAAEATSDAVVMDAKIWEKLEEDVLLEEVLPVMEIRDLCRFRAVCKRWSRLIYGPEFAKSIKSDVPYMLIAAEKFKLEQGHYNKWEICDTKTHKHYLLDDSFMNRLPMNRHRSIDTEILSNRRRPSSLPASQYIRSNLAADKGFICVLWRRENGHDTTIYVVNPVTKSFQQIPCFNSKTVRCSHERNAWFTMVVADDHLSFKLFVLQQFNLESSNVNDRYFFDSKVGRWQELSRPSFKTGLDIQYRMCHMLKIDKMVYTILIRYEIKTRHELFVYDTDQDLWTDLEVENIPHVRDFTQRRFKHPQLVASSGRLFFTVWEDTKFMCMQAGDDPNYGNIPPLGRQRIRIWEVDLASKKCEKVVPTNRIDLSGLINPEISLARQRVIDVNGSPKVLAIGTDDGCIVFTSVSGSSVAFRLSTRSWEHILPDWKSVDLGRLDQARRVGLFGCMMALTLLPVPSVAEPVPAVVP
ncbi:hypothetical protein KC19_4G220200 [Ceratodon purpureus]|nr:hypothetical protein KC19_4G220200 [Ceratodon purpureus]